jgi:hypothetical protein
VETKMEKEIKKNVGKEKSLIILLVVAFIIILGLVLYICYDKGIMLSKGEETKSNNTVSEKDENFEDIDLNDSRFYSLYTTLKGFTYRKSRAAGVDDFSNQELAKLAFGTADVKKSDFTELSDENENGFIRKSFSSDIVTPNINKIFNTNVSIDYSKLKRIPLITILANPNYEYELSVSENYGTCFFDIESYDEKTKQIVAKFDNIGCGGTSGPGANITERKIVSAKKSNDTIIVEEKVIYVDNIIYEDSNGAVIYDYYVYSDNEETNLLDSFTYSQDTVSDENITVESYLDKAATITHTYKLNTKTNEYYFVSSVIK